MLKRRSTEHTITLLGLPHYQRFGIQPPYCKSISMSLSSFQKVAYYILLNILPSRYLYNLVYPFIIWDI